MPNYADKNRQELVDKLISQLESGTAPWQKPWTSVENMAFKPAFNPVTKNYYNGVNRFRLMLAALDKGYKDNRWCTFDMASKNKWHIKKGEKGTPIEWFNRYDKNTKKPFDEDTVKDMTPQERSEYLIKNTYTQRKIYYVFNAEQMENIPKLELKPESEQVTIERHERLENLIKKFQCPVYFDKDDSAYYSVTKDEIHLPFRENFKNEYGLYSTFLHEAAHSTGHSSRLNRFKGVEANAAFGSESYAKEELRAEIASMFLSDEYHLQNSEEHIKQHAAYVKSWIAGLKKDTNYLFDAISDASKIASYLEDFEHSLNNVNVAENSSESDMANTQVQGEDQHLETENQPATSQDVQTSENASRTVQQQQSKEYPVFVQRTEDVIRESAKLALKTGEPMVAFEWCELNKPEYRGTVMPLSMADKMLTEDNQRYLSEGGYFKTKLHISYLDSNGKIQQYLDCRYDIGSENGGLEKHIREAYDGLLKAGFSSKEQRDEIFKMCDYLFSKDNVAETESADQPSETSQDAQSEQNEQEMAVPQEAVGENTNKEVTWQDNQSDNQSATSPKDDSVQQGGNTQKKKKWNEIFVSKDALIKKYDNSSLLKMPKNSEYSDYVYYMFNNRIKESDNQSGTYKLLLLNDESVKLRNRNGDIIELTPEEFSKVVNNTSAEDYAKVNDKNVEQASETSQDAQSEQNKPESENEAQDSPKKPPKSISDTAEEEKPQNFEEKPQKTKVINLYAGPGAGKTTAALQICLELKKLGINAEYVSEFAKDLIYDGKEEMLKDQKFVTDGQYERLNRLRGKVDVIVTDSPLLLGQVYGKKSIDKDYKDEIRKRYDSFDNYNTFIVRGKNFTQKGRVHNLEESKQLDADVLQMLSDNKIFHGYYKQDNLSEAVENIEKWLDKDKVSTIANEADVADKALTNSTSQPKTKKIKQRIQDR